MKILNILKVLNFFDFFEKLKKDKKTREINAHQFLHIYYDDTMLVLLITLKINTEKSW